MVSKKTPGPLRSAPLNIKKDVALDAFAAGALSREEAEPAEPAYPWEEAYVRDDVMKQILLKMPEPLYLKLKHIASYTPYNMTSFILERIAPEIDREIVRMTGRSAAVK